MVSLSSLLSTSFSVHLDGILTEAIVICYYRVTSTSVSVATWTCHGSLHSLCNLVATLLACLCISEESLLMMTSLFYPSRGEATMV